MKYPPPEKLTLWQSVQVLLVTGSIIVLIVGMVVGAFFLNSYRWGGGCP